MKHFAGLEVQPVSKITHFPSCKIDQTLVTGNKSLFGEIDFVVMGWVVDKNMLVPLCHATTEFEHAWAIKQAFDQKIEAARRQDLERTRAALIKYHGGFEDED